MISLGIPSWFIAVYHFYTWLLLFIIDTKEWRKTSRDKKTLSFNWNEISKVDVPNEKVDFGFFLRVAFHLGQILLEAVKEVSTY